MQMICPSCGYDNIPGSDECAECLTSLAHEDIPPDEARDVIEHALMEITVDDLHPAKAICVGESTSVMAAIERMRADRIGCLLVEDDAGTLTGIFTERDLLNKAALEQLDLARTPISGLMTAAPETIEADRPIAHALHKMMVGDLRHLPLTDANGHAVGIISSRNIVARLADLIGVE
jgi:CBS domain-containing protein